MNSKIYNPSVRAVVLALTLNVLTLCAEVAETAAYSQTGTSSDAKPRSGNPIVSGWYADPEATIFGNQYWIYPTYSAAYGQQVFFDAFSSSDLVHWTKHSRILSTNE